MNANLPTAHSLAWVIAEGLQALGDVAGFARYHPDVRMEIGAVHRFGANLILALESGAVTPEQLSALFMSQLAPADHPDRLPPAGASSSPGNVATTMPPGPATPETAGDAGPGGLFHQES